MSAHRLAKSAPRQSTLAPGTPAPGRDPLPWLIGALCFLCYAYFLYLGGNWNVNTRLNLVRALAQQRTFAIDRYHRNTGDKAYFGGHYYCDKAPGASLLGVPAYMALRPAGRALAERGSLLGPFLAQYGVSLFSTALPSALAAVALYLLLAPIAPDPRARIWGTLAYALGTLAFPYSTVMFGHQTAAALLLVALAALFRQRKRGLRPRWVALAGLAAGYAVITDYLAALPFLAMSAYAAWLAGRTSAEQPSPGRWSAKRAALGLLPWALGAAGPAAFLAYYNWTCFGSPLSVGHSHEVEVWFARGWSTGFLGLTRPSATALYQLTIGPLMGLFYTCPYLLLAFPGLWWVWRKGWRAEAVLCGSVTALGTLLVSSWVFWFDGPMFGARYLIVFLPFLAVPAAGAFDRAPTLFRALAALSMLSMAVVAVTAPMIMATVWSPVEPRGLGNPLLQYHYPRFFQALFEPSAGLLAPNLMTLLGQEGPASLVPLAGVVVLCLAAIVRRGRPGGSPKRAS